MCVKNSGTAGKAEKGAEQMNRTVNEQRFLELLQLVKQRDYPDYLAQVAILLCAVGEQYPDSALCSCFEKASKHDLTQAISRIKGRSQAYLDADISDKAATLIREYWGKKNICAMT